ncbi:MAG: glycerophosphodiester phosphodiesterase [Solirubrobacterales bacterium]|nr:glycerophosphodiester phosphodiesterase [Solirubrobacterales bacterium]
MIRIGHKGADALVPGNTTASFEAAVEIGVDLIEFDVLWKEDGHPDLPAGERSPLVVAHDWEAAAGVVPTLEETLAAFNQPPLDRIRINLDLKLPGREEEVVGSLRDHGLLERASISTMETPTIERIGKLEPGLRLGWTVPRATRDWTSSPWLRPVFLAGAAVLRRRLPGVVRAGIPRLGVDAVWAFHGIVTEQLIEVTREAGVDLNVWTVDEPDAVARFRDLGVAGIVSNDPRLLQP